MNLSKISQILSLEPKYRLKQAMDSVYKEFIDDWMKAKTIPLPLREQLNKECPLRINAEMFEDKNSKKALLTLDDGSKIETVLMMQSAAESSNESEFESDYDADSTRNSVCVSSQVGCPLKCDFCATGRLGLKRNLTSNEIVEQVLFWERILHRTNERVDNVTFMGMGEPLLNYDNVIEAVRIINSKDGLNIGARKISISTAGIIAGIKKLAEEPYQVNLALSLHTPNETMRSVLMPINKTYPLGEVLKEVASYIKKTNRKVMIEYIMIQDINDSVETAKYLAHILKKTLKHLFIVNLIPANPTGKYQASLPSQIEKFRETLESQDVNVTQRFRFGRSIKGACGQLAGAKSTTKA